MTDSDRPFEFPVLHTERLLLRPLASGDLDFVFRHFNSEAVNRYLRDDDPCRRKSRPRLSSISTRGRGTCATSTVMTTERGLQQLYPTRFSLRVMGEDKDSFARLVYGIVKTHVPELEEDRLTSRTSSTGKYLSVTITFIAQSREQLDAIYQDLSNEKRVLMVL